MTSAKCSIEPWAVQCYQVEPGLAGGGFPKSANVPTGHLAISFRLMIRGITFLRGQSYDQVPSRHPSTAGATAVGRRSAFSRRSAALLSQSTTRSRIDRDLSRSTRTTVSSPAGMTRRNRSRRERDGAGYSGPAPLLRTILPRADPTSGVARVVSMPANR